ncbi:MAG: sigma-54-dependent Fis family transcriptional regulator, partial [Hymenobacter sp.]
LTQQPLPGNVRELKNLVERTALMSAHDELQPADFQPAAGPRPAADADAPAALPAPGTMTLEQLEEQMIRQSLGHYQGNLSRVAKALGLSRGALYRRLEKFNIPYQTE